MFEKLKESLIADLEMAEEMVEYTFETIDEWLEKKQFDIKQEADIYVGGGV